MPSYNSSDTPSDLLFKALVVSLIKDGKVETAIELLSKRFKTKVPSLKVGIPISRGRQVAGCYSAKDQTIRVRDSDTMKEPFVILHEFYHHLRTSVDKKHRGTERYANAFAAEFIAACRSFEIH